jgi:hypothetical protein
VQDLAKTDHKAGKKISEPSTDGFRVQGSPSSPFPYAIHRNEKARYILMGF